MYFGQRGSLRLLACPGHAPQTVVLCLARDHVWLRARIALMPECMSKLDVLQVWSKWASCTVTPTLLPTSCWIDPYKMLDWEELYESEFWGGLEVWELRGRNQPLGNRAFSRDTSMGLEVGRCLNAICPISFFSTHPISISLPAFVPLLERLQKEGYSWDAAVYSTCWHPFVLLQAHRA